MDRIIEALGGVGLLVMLAGVTPLIASVLTGNASPDSLNTALETGLPFIIAGLLILGFVTALSER